METILENLPEQTITEISRSAATPVIKPTSRFGLTKQAQEFESARFGWMAILLTFQSCLGAVACLHISHHSTSMIAMASCAAVTMGSNALFIALAPARVCLAGFYLSVLINVLLILAYF